MGEASIPVDLANPGQVFACLGFVEAVDVLHGEARGGFDWQSPEEPRFQLAASGDENPVGRVLRFLDEATVKSIAPIDSPNNTNGWGIETITDKSGAFPFRDPPKPATLPACLEDTDGNRIVIDYWGDSTRRDNTKFWGGSKGKPGAKLALEALDLARNRISTCIDDPFSLVAEQSGSFRFDWRRDYIPIDTGFSLNKHKATMIMRGYPIVELLAAIGLTHARPLRHGKLEYSYGVAGIVDANLYDPIFLRAVLGASQPPFPSMPLRLFSMHLDWPGQEGQARCITNVIEETLSS